MKANNKFIWAWAGSDRHGSWGRRFQRAIVGSREPVVAAAAGNEPAARLTRRSAGYRMLPGLHIAANSLQANLNELGRGAPFRSIDVRRLCAASLSAGRLIGYLEALEATDRRLARAVAGDLSKMLESVERVRKEFEISSD
jgi:hypothetical protein